MAKVSKYQRRKRALEARDIAEQAANAHVTLLGGTVAQTGGGVVSTSGVEESAVSSAAEGSAPQELPLEVMEKYIDELGEALELTTGGRTLTPTQRETLKRLLSDEDSLLRMWCDGRLEAWEKEVLSTKPPTLVSGVLGYKNLTFGADWELPFARSFSGEGEWWDTFAVAFARQLRLRGLTVHSGKFDPPPLFDESPPPFPRVRRGGFGPVFVYSDGRNVEYGFAVARDNRDGWKYVDRVFAAFNDLNQGVKNEALTIMGFDQPTKGCVAKLLAPHPKFGRLISGWHIHLRLAKTRSSKDIARITTCADLVQRHIYRLGQDKKVGWRASRHTTPRRGMYRVKTHTIQFRPNDTYVETDDPKATFRRFQAQVAYYSGIYGVAVAPKEGYDYTILGSRTGEGLSVYEDLREERKQRLEKVHFLASLDLFANRKAKTATGEKYDVRRLVYYEWATSRPVADHPTIFPKDIT